MEDKELKTLTNCFESLSELDEPARQRVLAWLNSRFLDEPSPIPSNTPPTPSHAQPEAEKEEEPATELDIPYEHLSELLSKLYPRTAAEKVLYTSCYLHKKMGMRFLTGRVINDELKKHEEGVRNITATINALIEKTPAMMAQLEKNGKTAQAQKKYVVTEEGKREIMQKLDLLGKK
ncbi:hypothetical protein R9C00_13455 [Flammeovirgaceae bacterium SG7u.111]|nr:hypothetical protein [Flammeovirgaceae bacterium SG7u.132]WPO38464.1 hypothetical protein R9C00_13455 [Flammeovirgaceae bacterium SG7u.111]